MNAPTETDGGGPGDPAAPPSQPSQPTGIDRALRHDRPTRTIAVLVGVIALAFDLAVHHQPASLATAIAVAVAVAGLVASGRMRNRQAFVVGAGAVLVGSFVALRTSPWLVPSDVVAAVVLVVLAAGFAPGGSITSLSGAAVLGQAGRAIVAGFSAPAYALGCVGALLPTGSDEGRRRAIAIGRGIGVALPVVVVLGVLLASADAVFASIFTVPTDPGSVLGYVGFGLVGAIGASALFVSATLPPAVDRAAPADLLGATEAAVVLGSMTLLYAVFAGAQVVAITGGAEHVIETAGLTYADYARGGFFQLVAVAAITLAVLGALRVGTREEPGRRLGSALLGEAVIVLTLVIVAVAIRRLALYEAEFGSTMLRLASTAAAAWLGVVFVFVGLATAGLGRRRRWLLGAVVTSALVALVAWNVVNPEAVVVDRNLARYTERGRLDTDYLWALSDDAVPAMAAMLPTLDPDTRAAVIQRICLVPSPDSSAAVRRSGPGPDRGSLVVTGTRSGLGAGPGAPGGPPAPAGLDANRSARTAADVRAGVCA